MNNLLICILNYLQKVRKKNLEVSLFKKKKKTNIVTYLIKCEIKSWKLKAFFKHHFLHKFLIIWWIRLRWSLDTDDLGSVWIQLIFAETEN